MAGADVFRLNFSHGSHDDHAARHHAIRSVERDIGRPVGVLDLQGPKLRVGRMAGGRAMLETGSRFRLDLDPAEGTAARAGMPHPEIFAALRPGTDLLLDDGKLRLRVDACGPDFAETTVMAGGVLSDRKGVNVPGAVLPVSPLTVKDRADLAFGLELGVDWVALSFVQRPEDIVEARGLVGDRAWIMAKLEKPAAIDALDGIGPVSGAIGRRDGHRDRRSGAGPALARRPGREPQAGRQHDGGRHLLREEPLV
jgi:pyruvate kinase